MTADHLVRPIMVPRDVNVLPWHSGYAEAINAGKSLRNEDQAAFHRGVLRACDLPTEVESELESSKTVDIPYVYFGTFDGHAGSGCAVAAANELHVVLHRDVLALINSSFFSWAKTHFLFFALVQETAGGPPTPHAVRCRQRHLLLSERRWRHVVPRP